MLPPLWDNRLPPPPGESGEGSSGEAELTNTQGGGRKRAWHRLCYALRASVPLATLGAGPCFTASHPPLPEERSGAVGGSESAGLTWSQLHSGLIALLQVAF